MFGQRNRELEVKKLRNLNKAVLAKWSWCFTIEKGVLCNDVVRDKYREQEGSGSFVKSKGMK